MTYVLRDLPNEEGFRFIGVKLDGSEIECIIGKNSIGCYEVYDLNGNPCWTRLYGWKRITSEKSK